MRGSSSSKRALSMNYQVARMPNEKGKVKFNLHGFFSICFLLNSSYKGSSPKQPTKCLRKVSMSFLEKPSFQFFWNGHCLRLDPTSIATGEFVRVPVHGTNELVFLSRSNESTEFRIGVSLN